MSISRIYRKTIKKELNYYPTWLPNADMKLGNIGIFQRGVFYCISNLRNEGIDFDVEASNGGDFYYCSRNGVNIVPKVATEAPNINEVEVSLTFSFSDENSIFFNIKNAEIHRIKDQIKIGKDIMALYDAGKWKKEWVVITEVIKSYDNIILVSKEKDAMAEIRGMAKVGQIENVNIDASFNITNMRNISTHLLCSQATPLFRASKIRNKGSFSLGNLFRKGVSPMPSVFTFPNLIETKNVFDCIDLDDLDDDN